MTRAVVTPSSVSPQSNPPIALPIRPVSVAVVLGLCISLLLIVHVAVQAVFVFTGHDRIFGLRGLFDLDAEQNLPTLFSTMHILANAGLCALVWQIQRTLRRADVTWLALSAALACVGVDEFGSIHEMLVEPLIQRFHFTGLFYFAWVVPYGLLAIALAVGFLPFLFRLEARTRWLLVAAGVVYVVGAVGFEMMAGALFEQTRNKQAPLWMLLTTFEEVFEMVGMSIFTYALLDLMVETYHVEAIVLPFGPAVSTASHTPEPRV